MNEKKTKVMFFFNVEQDSVQTAVHILSAVSVLFVIDLLTDWNPVKTFVRSFIPKISVGGSDSDSDSTTSKTKTK